MAIILAIPLTGEIVPITVTPIVGEGSTSAIACGEIPEMKVGIMSLVTNNAGLFYHRSEEPGLHVVPGLTAI